MNYIINGFNARISAYYEHGDLYTKGLNYAPGVTGQKVDVFIVSVADVANFRGDVCSISGEGYARE